MVLAPQTPRSEEWVWIKCGRITQCHRGEALSEACHDYVARGTAAARYEAIDAEEWRFQYPR